MIYKIKNEIEIALYRGSISFCFLRKRCVLFIFQSISFAHNYLQINAYPRTSFNLRSARA